MSSFLLVQGMLMKYTFVFSTKLFSSLHFPNHVHCGLASNWSADAVETGELAAEKAKLAAAELAKLSRRVSERDKLHKSVEELCMQKDVPEFVSLVTQTYFRRTAGLEQEAENLKKEKADCEKENSDIKKQLSEAKRIKTYLEQLHGLEVSKNAEAAKQLDYFRDLVATAFLIVIVL